MRDDEKDERDERDESWWENWAWDDEREHGEIE